MFFCGPHLGRPEHFAADRPADFSGTQAREVALRPDAAAGGNRSAMTMRMVPEAVEPRARAQVYVQHDLVWHRGDNLRGGNSR